MTQAKLIEQRKQILAKLEEMGIETSGVTGTRHHIPKPGEIAVERKQIALNEQNSKSNQQYYLNKAKKTGKPWHHHPKQSEQYSEFVLVTPEMAKVLLEWNKNPRTRIMQTVVDRYARDIVDGEWNDNTQPVAIDYNGYMHNGQHRISAIIQCNKPQRLWFTFQSLVSAREDEDIGAPRKPAVQIELQLNNRLGNKLPAICRAAICGVNGTKLRPSPSQLREFAEKYGATIEWLERICPSHRSDVMGALLKAVLWHGADQMEPFLHRFGNVLFESTEDPARLLHQASKVIRGIKHRISLYKKTLAAVHHYVNDRRVSKLIERNEDLFEWGPNFSIPAKS